MAPGRDWVIDRLLKAANGPDSALRQRAISALGEIGAASALTSKLLRTRGAPRQIRLIDVLRRMVPHLSVRERLHLQGDLDLVAFRARSMDVSVAVARVHEAVIAAERAAPSKEWS
jgi:hypothetical protein